MKENRTDKKNLCWLLVKNRLIAQFGIHIFLHEKNKQKKNRKIATSIAIILCLIMIAAYCMGMAYGYVYLGLGELVPGISMFLSSMLALLFTMFKANGELFAFHDYDVLMSLPIPARTIINSRFISMYIWNTLLACLVMIPMGGIYAAYTKPAFSFYIMWIAGILLTSLIPTTIAAVFGAIITGISSKFRYASAVSTILSIVLIVGIMVFSMTAASGDMGLGVLFDSETGNINEAVFADMAPAISDALNRIYPPIVHFTKAAVDGNMSSFFIFAGSSMGWYLLFVLLLSTQYKKINTALTSQRSRADYKMKTLHQSSMLFTLYKKTLMRILKNTVCATNLLVGCVLAILMAAVLFLVGVEPMMKRFDALSNMHIGKNVASYVIAAVVCMTNTACISLALEGKNVWLMKSLPIPPKTLYSSYLLTNLTFTVPTSIICSILFSLSIKTDLVETILMIVTPLTFSLLTAVVGIFMGNRMAYYDWADETQIVKQSALSLLGMLGGTILAVICGLIANIGILPFKANMNTFIINILLLVLAAAIYFMESTRPIKE